MHYFSYKFLKIKLGSRPHCPLTVDFGDLKLRDLAKLWFYILVMSKSNLKNSHCVISATSSKQKKLTKIASLEFSMLPLPPSMKLSGYPSVFQTFQ